MPNGTPKQLANLCAPRFTSENNPSKLRSQEGKNPFRIDADFRQFMRENAEMIQKGQKVTKPRIRFMMERLFATGMAGGAASNRAIEILLERGFGEAEKKIDIASSGGSVTINIITGVEEPKDPLPDAIDVTPKAAGLPQPAANSGFVD